MPDLSAFSQDAQSNLSKQLRYLSIATDQYPSRSRPRSRSPEPELNDGDPIQNSDNYMFSDGIATHRRTTGLDFNATVEDRKTPTTTSADEEDPSEREHPESPLSRLGQVGHGEEIVPGNLFPKKKIPNYRISKQGYRGAARYQLRPRRIQPSLPASKSQATIGRGAVKKKSEG